MIHGLTILSGGDDLERQAAEAVTSRAMRETIQHRHGHIFHGHDRASDDAKTYPEMMANFGRDHVQPMLDRTQGNATVQELIGAATAAAKGAARLIAFADKAHRHAAQLAAEQEENEP